MSYQARIPVNGLDYNSKWKYENVSEESVMGHQFAQAILLVASGQSEEVTKKKKKIDPCRKIFWEEHRFNPALENSNGNYAFDAHFYEESKHWSKAGKKFVGGLRFPAERDHCGPLNPAEFPHVYEKPISMFNRSGELRPFDRAKRLSRASERVISNPEKVCT
jgi:hypothetical protein